MLKAKEHGNITVKDGKKTIKKIMETLNAELFKIEYPNRAIVRDKSFANDAGYRIDEKTDDYWMNNVIGDAGRSTSWIVYLRFENNVTFEDHDLVDLLVDDLLIAGKTITFFENWYHVTFDPTDDPENEGELLSAFRFIKAIRDAVHPISVEKAGVVQKKHIRLQGSAKLKDADIDSRKLDTIPRIGEVIDGFTCIDVLNIDHSDIDLFGADKCAGVFVKLNAIESCNYERALEIAQSLSAELLPVNKAPKLCNFLSPFFGLADLVNMWTEELIDGECKVYYNDADIIHSKYISVADNALAIPCRVIIYDKYVKSLFHNSNSTHVELGLIKEEFFFGKIDRLRVELLRKSDGAIVASTESIDVSNVILQYKEAFTTNAIEIAIKYRYNDHIGDVYKGYFIYIDEVSTNNLSMPGNYTIAIYGI